MAEASLQQSVLPPAAVDHMLRDFKRPARPEKPYTPPEDKIDRELHAPTVPEKLSVDVAAVARNLARVGAEGMDGRAY